VFDAAHANSPAVRLVPLIAVVIDLLGLSAGAHGTQVPPSIRAVAPPSVSDEERETACREINGMMAALNTDAVWLRQPYSETHVRDLQAILASLNCPGAAGVQGTWQITGVPNPNAPNQRNESAVMILERIDEPAGIAEAKKSYGGFSLEGRCFAGEPYFTGTITFAVSSPWRLSDDTPLPLTRLIACGENPIKGRFAVVDRDGAISSGAGGDFQLNPTGPKTMRGSWVIPGGPNMFWDLHRK
jgi:hypothetical protein